MRLLVTGAKGLLGTDLLPVLQNSGYEVIAFGSSELNITDEDSIKYALTHHKPDVVVNCAAYTAVDKAEEEHKEAQRITDHGAGLLAAATKQIGARLVHFSTDFVFDGTSNTPYTEEDKTNPIGVYGKTKLDGELKIIASGARAVIIRTSWLYGHTGKCFVRSIIDGATKKDELRVVSDQVGSPTYSVDLSVAAAALIENGYSGIVNFSNEGIASWYDFATLIVKLARDNGVSVKCKSVTPIKSIEYPLAAKRPCYSVLDKTLYRKLTGRPVPHWMDALKRYIQ
ncbi:MAG: dTDP-4-dehydrorhamnose reductase, partial [Deltaproteobacteria bacterium]|nr:dTDP-4-dehydrorhamnose reductase [Deltaproteobacteria bacterium]